MNGLLGDLLDFTRSRLDRGIPITPTQIDLAEIGRKAVDEWQATHPTEEMRFEVKRQRPWGVGPEPRESGAV